MPPTKDFKSLVENEDPDELFELIDEIAVGSYGSVYKAKHIPTQSIIALKIMEPDEDEELDDFAAEIAVLKECSHPNLVNYVGSYLKGSEIFIAMELADGGACNDIFKYKEVGMAEPYIQAICRESMVALEYMHTHRIVHRDIKAANILLCSDGRVKLADFGVAALLKDKPEGAFTFIGTPYWMAPEVIDNKSASINAYDMKCDIWSMGITCIELAQVTPPLSDVHPMRALFQIPLEDPPKLKEPAKWSDSFHDYLVKSLYKDPKQRSTSAELLNHPWLLISNTAPLVSRLVKEMYRLKAKSKGESTDILEDTSPIVAIPMDGAPPPKPERTSHVEETPPPPPPEEEEEEEEEPASESTVSSPSGPDLTVSDDEQEVVEAKQVLNATVRKATLAREKRPQRRLTAREEVALANQIRARKLYRSQMKEIDKLKKQHDAAEAALQKQFASEQDIVNKKYDDLISAAESKRDAAENQLRSQLKKEKDKMDKDYASESKGLAKRQKAEAKERNKAESQTLKRSHKGAQARLKEEIKEKEEELRRSDLSKKEIKDQLSRFEKERSLQYAQSAELEKLAREFSYARKWDVTVHQARYEHLHSGLNMALENHEKVQEVQAACLEEICKLRRKRLAEMQPLDLQCLQQRLEREHQHFTERYKLEMEHQTKSVEEEHRFQVRELNKQMREDEKKYKKKLAKERKKHASMGKKEWKELVAREDAKRAEAVEKKKADFKAESERDKAEQIRLQAKRHEQLDDLQKQKAAEKLNELKAKQAMERKQLDIELQRARVDLLSRQHQETAALVQSQFDQKRGFRAALHQERTAVLKQQHAEMISLAKSFGPVDRRLEEEQRREMDELLAAGKQDAAKILEAFHRLCDLISKNQKAEMDALMEELQKLEAEM